MRSEQTSERSGGVIVDAAVRLGDTYLCPAVQFEAEPGQIVGVSGASGSGKSTLLRLLVGDVPAGARVEGSVRVGGIDPLALDGGELCEHRRTRVAFVGQDPGAELNPVMKVRRIIRELARTADVADSLSQVQLDPALARRRIHQLSGGQQRRVALARALARTPDVLVLDEPFSGLDHRTAAGIANLLRAAADRGTVVVMTGHDGVLLEQSSHRVIKVGEMQPTVQSARGDSPELDEGSAGEAVLSARGIGVDSPAGQPLIRDLDLDLPRNSLTALLGASGSGKSTLLRALQGHHPLAAGSLTLNGASRLPSRGVPRNRRREVQLVPQDPLSTLNPTLTAHAAVARAARHHPGIESRQAARERARKLLLDVGLASDLHERAPAALSGGQRQRVAIARAIAPAPDVLLCDEVTSALDAESAEEVMHVLRGLAMERTPVLLATHDEDLAERHCPVRIQL